jgi:hypothetical protein
MGLLYGRAWRLSLKHCRFVPPLIHSTPASLTDSAIEPHDRAGAGNEDLKRSHRQRLRRRLSLRRSQRQSQRLRLRWSQRQSQRLRLRLRRRSQRQRVSCRVALLPTRTEYKPLHSHSISYYTTHAQYKPHGRSGPVGRALHCVAARMAAAYESCREAGRSIYKYGDGVKGGVGWGLSATVLTSLRGPRAV